MLGIPSLLGEPSCPAEGVNLTHRRATECAIAVLGISSASYLTLSWKRM